MLATFNEILFKMPSADSLRFHVEIQLEGLFEKVCSLPTCLCDVWNPKEVSHQSEGIFRVSRSVSALAMRVFSSLRGDYKDCLVCVCAYSGLRRACIFAH